MIDLWTNDDLKQSGAERQNLYMPIVGVDLTKEDICAGGHL